MELELLVTQRICQFNNRILSLIIILFCAFLVITLNTNSLAAFTGIHIFQNLPCVAQLVTKCLTSTKFGADMPDM